MSDHPDDRDAEHGDADPTTSLPSARERATFRRPRSARDTGSALPPGRDGRRGAGKGGRRATVGHARKPKPARALDESAAVATPVAPDVAETAFEVGDERWVVRVLGRSGGSVVGAAPLLLLEFRRDPATEAGPEDGARETLVVARTLAGLSEDDLERAWRQSAAPRPRDRERTFFGDGGGRARR